MEQHDETSMAEKFARALLNIFCPSQLREEIEGDLLQRYARDIKSIGKSRARLRLIWNAARFARPGIVFRNKFKIPLIPFYMIRNYIKIAFRSFRKQKVYTFLNVVGLSLGMAASLLIIQYVKYERSFDAFHARAKDIYRIQYNGYANGQLNFESAVTVPAASAALKNNFPEVEQYTRLYPTAGVITYEHPVQGTISFFEQKMQWADSSLFKVFNFEMVKGDPLTALKGIGKTVITESAARRFFGFEDPIGKRVNLDGDWSTRNLEVTGVIRDVPENSHIKFTFLLSYETLNNLTKNQSDQSWGWYDFYSFVLLKPDTDVKVLQAKWDEYLVKTRKEEWEKRGFRQEFILRPLLGIHLDSNLLYEAQPDERRDGDSVYALGFIAIFILIIAWVNYVNLATARAMGRANEVGVRKVIGALRTQLIGQFLTESFLLNVIAVGIGLVAVRLLWEPFSSLAGWSIPMDYLFTADFWWLLAGLFITGAIVSGFYPAIILSSFRPVAVLKGKVVRTTHGNLLRKSLVVFQFVASIFLITGSLIVYQQLQFMKNRDLGVDIHRTLVLRGPRLTDSLYVNKWNGFKNDAQSITGIESVTAGSNIPGAEIYWTSGISTLTTEKRGIVTAAGAVDQDYLPSYGIEIVAGRNFSKEFPNENKHIIINKALAQVLGFNESEKAITEKVRIGRDTVEIVGVIDDYHQMSLKSKVAPLALRYSEDSGTYYSFKLSTDDYQGIISALEQPWKSYFPGNPIDYFFLDQFFNRQYDKDNRFGMVFNLFTALAILIASLGLFGLASFIAMQRTKEIGIRKVLGSTVSGIVFLLARGFLLPVLLANIIAWPLAWWTMNRWLQTFPYRIDINPLLFIAAGLLVVVIAFISVAGQTLKAALLQPAETLKYE